MKVDSELTVVVDGGRSSLRNNVDNISVGKGCYFIYLCFLADFFLHFSARIPAVGVLRPTLLLVGVLFLMLIAQKEKLRERSKDPIFAALVALMIYIIVSLPLVEYPGSVLRVNLAGFIKAVVFFFFTAYIVDTEKRLKFVVGFFMMLQVFRALEPLYLHMTTGYWGDYTYIGGGEFAGRLSGAPADVINANELGFVIVTAIPFLHFLLFPSGFKNALLYFLLLPLLLYALILTMSRGAFIALCVVAWMVFKDSKRKFSLIVVGMVSLVMAWSVMTPLQKDRYLSLVESDTSGSKTVDGRVEGMKREFLVGLERPIVGHGLGTASETKFHKYGESQPSHNFYAELLMEIGFVGMIFFFRFMKAIVVRFRNSQELIKKISLPPDHYFVRLNKTLTVVFWMYAVYSFNYWGLSQYYWYFFAGLVASYSAVLFRLQKYNAGEFVV